MASVSFEPKWARLRGMHGQQQQAREVGARGQKARGARVTILPLALKTQHFVFATGG